MKDKRLEVKLSVRGDGSLTRNGTRSSTRSNRSNASSNGLLQSEIFATDRYSTPYYRSFDILDKYRRQPDQYGYPAQSLQALNRYEQQPRINSYKSNPYIDYNEQHRTQYPIEQRSDPYRTQYSQVQRNESPRTQYPHQYLTEERNEPPRVYYPQQYTVEQRNEPPSSYQPQQYRPLDQRGYQPVYNHPSIRLHGTLPRSSNHHDQQKGSPYATNTLPARSGPRRVRISDLQPIVHGYGMYIPVSIYYE